MPDIELRLGHDMLVLSAPVDAMLVRQGIDVARDRQYLNLMEPDAISDALRMELMAGAQCLVTTTEDITRARLAHVRMENDAARLARAAVDVANELKPQHLLAEIGPTGLPLDASSKASLNESRAQYADAARAFEGCAIDAFFLNGFSSIADLKCALMGVSQVSGKPVFASVVLGDAASDAEPKAEESAEVPSGKESLGSYKKGADLFARSYEPIDGPIAPAVPQVSGRLSSALWPDAISAMQDLGATVIGFETDEPLAQALEYAQVAVGQSGLPILAQLRVGTLVSKRAASLVPLESRTDYAPETLEHAAVRLYGAGVQFLRATGLATSAHTGALAATVSGLDVHRV